MLRAKCQDRVWAASIWLVARLLPLFVLYRRHLPISVINTEMCVCASLRAVPISGHRDICPIRHGQ
jgi:hypothetical protein